MSRGIIFFPSSSSSSLSERLSRLGLSFALSLLAHAALLLVVVDGAGHAPRVGRRGLGREGGIGAAAAAESDDEATLFECRRRCRRFSLVLFFFPLRLALSLPVSHRVGDRRRQERR